MDLGDFGINTSAIQLPCKVINTPSHVVKKKKKFANELVRMFQLYLTWHSTV